MERKKISERRNINLKKKTKKKFLIETKGFWKGEKRNRGKEKKNWWKGGKENFGKEEKWKGGERNLGNLKGIFERRKTIWERLKEKSEKE